MGQLRYPCTLGTSRYLEHTACISGIHPVLIPDYQANKLGRQLALSHSAQLKQVAGYDLSAIAKQMAQIYSNSRKKSGKAYKLQKWHLSGKNILI